LGDSRPLLFLTTSRILNHMVKYSRLAKLNKTVPVPSETNFPDRNFDLIFRALSSHARRDMLRVLGNNRPTTVGKISRSYNMSLPAVSKHIKVLSKAKLIRVLYGGRHTYIRLNQTNLRAASELIQKILINSRTFL